MLIAVAARRSRRRPRASPAGAIILRGRYDVRGAFLAVSMALRLAGSRSACRTALDGAVIGMVVAQVVATAAICDRRARARSGASRGAGPSRSATTAATLRQLRRSPRRSPRRSSRRARRSARRCCRRSRRSTRPAYFRNAQAPATGFAALSAPGAARAAHRADARLRGGPARPRCTRCCAATSSATALLMVVAVPVLWVLMPCADADSSTAPTSASMRRRPRGSCSSRRRCSSSGAGRSRSRSRSAGRGCAIVAQAVEIAVFVPLLLVLRRRVGRDRRGRRRCSSRRSSSAPLWSVLLARLHGEHGRDRGCSRAEGPRRLRDLAAGRRRPRAHAPEVAAFLLARGHEVEVVITADARAGAARRYPVHWVRAVAAAGRPPRRRASRLVAPRARRGRRRLHDRHVRPLVARRAARADAVRRQADRRPGVRARAALGPLARLARGVPDAARRRDARRSALARDVDVRRAAHVVTPSAYLRELALGWGVPPRARDACSRTRRRRCRSCARATSCAPSSASTARRSSFAGRLTAQKSLDVGIEAARRAGRRAR